MTLPENWKTWFLLLLLAGYGGWKEWSVRRFYQADGVLAAAMPLQTTLDDARPFDVNGYTITPLADFMLTARVLSRADYHFGRDADLVPTDIAFGWGRMSDSAVLEKISISQSNRFYFWQTDDPPIPLEEIALSSANMHLIPSTAAIQRSIGALRPGQVVKLRGKLVRADATDGWHWQSSLSREDTGGGACELVYVESVMTVQ